MIYRCIKTLFLFFLLTQAQLVAQVASMEEAPDAIADKIEAYYKSIISAELEQQFKRGNRYFKIPEFNILENIDYIDPNTISNIQKNLDLRHFATVDQFLNDKRALILVKINQHQPFMTSPVYLEEQLERLSLDIDSIHHELLKSQVDHISQQKLLSTVEDLYIFHWYYKYEFNLAPRNIFRPLVMSLTLGILSTAALQSGHASPFDLSEPLVMLSSPPLLYLALKANHLLLKTENRKLWKKHIEPDSDSKNNFLRERIYRKITKKSNTACRKSFKP